MMVTCLDFSKNGFDFKKKLHTGMLGFFKKLILTLFWGIMYIIKIYVILDSKIPKPSNNRTGFNLWLKKLKWRTAPSRCPIIPLSPT
jgi:hypothetical protein